MKKHLRLGRALLLAAVTISTLPGVVQAESAARNIVSIELFPKELVLSSVRDLRRLLVTGVGEDGLRYDLTSEATFSSAGPNVQIDGDGYVVPVSAGETAVLVSAAGLEAQSRVRVQDVSPVPVNFTTEVIPTLSKVGCNAGTCHGAQKGKAGFKLSLRGYDPLFDYRALVDDLSGRRFNRSMPSQSLMLLKPTQGVPHEGGFLFDEDHRSYKLIQQWIAEGCRFDEVSRVDRIEVFPKKPLLQTRGDLQQLIVIAHFHDGSSREVTREAVFDTSDFEVATVGERGLVRAVRRGEAATLVRYEGRYTAAPVAVIGSREGYEWIESPEFNFVDGHVNRKLERTQVIASDLCTDAEFLRRVSLDLTGLPPTADEARAFINDELDSQAKRTARIDQLMASPEFVDHWTLKWSDLLLSNRKFIKEKGVWAFRNWIRSVVATDMPYDQFARELMTASGSSFENPAANYYRIAREPNEVMANMTQVFLGTRFQCNQCHDHPFERWTQQQYYELSAFFSGVGRKRGSRGDDEVIFTLASPNAVKHPGTGAAVAAVFPFEHDAMPAEHEDPRQVLAEWLTAAENPYFAKSLVNRYWSYFTGRGIIEPVDDIRASNPPSNPELLDALTNDFVAHGFDLKHLIRIIVTSHTYQRSFRTNRWNADDDVNYSHALPRRLAAEQLYDAIVVATGAPANIPGVPSGFRATQLPDPQIKLSFLDMFGRAPRESPCECERSSAVSLAQTLNLINGPTISNAIIHPEGLVSRLINASADSDKLIESVYLSVIGRYPTAEESTQAAAYMAKVEEPAEAAQDLMWALINSPAFLFNR